MAERELSRCHQCGQVDDHPKSHWFPGGETYHHDCLPYDKKQELVASHPDAEAIVKAAESGKRGDELLGHIVSLAQARKESE